MSALKTAPKMIWAIRSQLDWLKEHAELRESGWFCLKTGKEIAMVGLNRSIWYEDLGPCAGEGEVRTVFHVYCPACDNDPKVLNGSGIYNEELLEVENG